MQHITLQKIKSPDMLVPICTVSDKSVIKEESDLTGDGCDIRSKDQD